MKSRITMGCAVLLLAAFAYGAEPYHADEHTLLLLHFNEAGTSAKDSSAAGNQVPLLKMRERDARHGDAVDLHESEGRFGSAVRFPGAHWAQVDQAKQWELDQQITLEVWVNLRPGQRGFIASNRAGSGEGFELMHIGDGRVLWTVETDRGRREVASGPMEPNQWHEVVAIYNGSRAALLVDGKLQGVNGLEGTLKNDKPLVLGREWTEVPNFLSGGAIDELRISKIARPEYVAKLNDAPVAAGAPGEAPLPTTRPRVIPSDLGNREFAVVVQAKPGEDIGELINATSQKYKYNIQIHVPAGTYEFETTIKLKAGDSLIGVGQGNTEEGYGTILDYTGDGRAIDCEGYLEHTSRRLVRIEGIYLRNYGKKGKYGVYCKLVTRYFTLRDMIIDGFDVGLYMDECWINRFVGLTVVASKTTNVWVHRSNIVSFYGCFFDGGDPGIRVSSSHTVSFYACDFESMRGSRSVIINDGAARVTLMDCHMEDNGKDAWIYTENSRGLRIEGCNLLGVSGRSGIELGSNVQGAVIFNNHFTGTTKAAIFLNGDGISQLAIGSNVVGGYVEQAIENPKNTPVSVIGFPQEDRK